jgi:signal transduction histidine kinase
MAEQNVRRMQRIVDDLLDLSRIESGGWRPKPVMVEMAPAAADVLLPLQGAADAKGVALRTDIAPGGERLHADPTAVRQVLSNLAENALRHTPAGEVVVFSTPEEGGTWIGVRDTGVGIGAEHLPRIFERFYRADPGRSREAGGTGLGLSIVRHLAEAHGGRVRAESVPGSGTTIACFLPNPPGWTGPDTPPPLGEES